MNGNCIACFIFITGALSTKWCSESFKLITDLDKSLMALISGSNLSVEHVPDVRATRLLIHKAQYVHGEKLVESAYRRC